jgi:hypothetical protein
VSAKSRGRKGNARGTKNRKSSGGFKKGVEAGKIGNNNAKKSGKKRGKKK